MGDLGRGLAAMAVMGLVVAVMVVAGYWFIFDELVLWRVAGMVMFIPSLVVVLIVASVVGYELRDPEPQHPGYGWHNDGDECTGPKCGNPAHFEDFSATRSTPPKTP